MKVNKNNEGQKNRAATKRSYLMAWIGVALEYYDSGLYWVMVPLLTPVFLPSMSRVDSLILAYGTYPLSVFSRPLGAMVIGRIGDKLGRKRALVTSIIGTALVTGLVGCLPSYEQIGILAPILFLLSRILQKFFVAGEYNGGAIFTLEHTKEGKGFMSGIYCGFTLLGVLAATVMATIVAHLPQGYWRLPYLLGFLTALVGLCIRLKAAESPEFEKKTNKDGTKNLKGKLQFYRKEVMVSVGVATCFSALCTLPLSFTNAFIPMVTHFTNQEVMVIDTMTLMVYILLLVISGRVADVIGVRTSMLSACLATIVMVCPLFMLLKMDTVWSVVCVKIGLGILVAWFVGPFHAWIQELYRVNSRYEMISITYSLGSQIGAFGTVLNLWLWKQTEYVGAPGLVTIIFALVGLGGLLYAKERVVQGLAQGRAF